MSNDSGIPNDQEHIFVVNPYEENFNSTRIATLLVNKELKQKYESIRESIDKAKTNLLVNIGKTSGLKKNTEQELTSAFNIKPNEIYSLLEGFDSDLNANPTYDFSDISYREIFNQKVQEFLAKPGIISLLHEYVSKYDELIVNSLYFRKGIFNHNNATTVSENLKKNGFFTAKHTVSLLDTRSQRKEITSEKEFDIVIEGEKSRILNDPELTKRFEAIDKEIDKNEGLRSFRTFLEKNPKILPELADVNSLKRKIWISYLMANKETFVPFIDTFKVGKKELEGVIKVAKEQSTLWHNVVKIFNERFSVPFIVEIANQDDVILKEEAPTSVFKYQDGTDQCEIGKDDLLNILSTGEKRALYILNVIFELEARKKLNNQTLLILDDIADSFDYKNKYAIIEYLKDNLETGEFFFIILTHNFDFFRTVQSRLSIGRRYNCLMSLKTETQVSLTQAQYLQPFEYWKDHLNDNNIMRIAAIPMVRNLIEYSQGQKCPYYLKLTSLLHQKSDSNSITLVELADIFNKTLNLNLNFGTGNVLPFIFQEAENCLNAPECINLENKVVLSIAIRLLAEDVMICRINDPSKTNTINGNQTAELFKMFKDLFGADTKSISVLDQVIMMTPEPIHLNSFMYEPLIDLSDYHLKELYKTIKAFSVPTKP